MGDVAGLELSARAGRCTGESIKQGGKREQQGGSQEKLCLGDLGAHAALDEGPKSGLCKCGP